MSQLHLIGREVSTGKVGTKYGTKPVLIYCDSGSDIRNVSVPVPAPDPDHFMQFFCTSIVSQKGGLSFWFLSTFLFPFYVGSGSGSDKGKKLRFQQFRFHNGEIFLKNYEEKTHIFRGGNCTLRFTQNDVPLSGSLSVPDDPTPSPTTGWKDGSERERLRRRDPVRDTSSPAQRHTAHQQVSNVNRRANFR